MAYRTFVLNAVWIISRVRQKITFVGLPRKAIIFKLVIKADVVVNNNFLAKFVNQF